MKEIPILFSTPMVEAILENHKIQTRRIVKTKQKGWDCQIMEFAKSETFSESFLEKSIASISLQKELVGFHAFFTDNESDHKIGIKCLYGQPGDLLWVREKWENESNGGKWINFYAGNVEVKNNKAYERLTKWKPSIHMPKAAARIWLQVEEIRVERLQDITEEDAIAEGIEVFEKGTDWMEARFGFEILWDKINGLDAWDKNPWVWVVKFKILSTTGKPSLEALSPSDSYSVSNL